MIDIRLDRQYRIYTKDAYNPFTVQRITRKRTRKTPIIEEHYCRTLNEALQFYVEDKIARKPEKIKTIQEYLDEYQKLVDEVAKIAKTGAK